MLGLPVQLVSGASWLFILATAGPLLVITSAIYNLYFHPLAHVPGPFWARASGIPSWYHAVRGKRHIWLWQMFQIYGNRIRAAPNLVLFCDPDAYAEIYGARSNVRRSHFYTAFRRNENDKTTLNTVDIAEHAAKRKLLNLCFTEKSVRAASTFMIKHIDRWNELMLEESSTEEWSDPVDFSNKLDELIFDVMGDISFGKSFDIKEPGENPWKTIPHSIAEYMRFYYPICRSPFLGLLLWLKPRGLNTLFDAITPPSAKNYYEFVHNSVTERIALYNKQKEKPEEERRQDIFYFLCEAQNPETGEPAFDEQALRSESNLLIIAGSDTTAISLTGIFFYLTGDPWRTQKLVDELRATFKKVEDIIYGQKLMTCIYLKSCIEEGMRLTPSGPCELPREVLQGGLRVLGEYYPPRTIVGTVPWCNSRNEEILGDPGVFRPERWIVDESTGVTKDSVARLRSNFHPFLSGPGSCVGKNIAMAEMMLVLARTLYRLEFRRLPGSTLGCGSPELGWGARDTKQLQLVDAYISLRQGPEIQFRKRIH